MLISHTGLGLSIYLDDDMFTPLDYSTSLVDTKESVSLEGSLIIRQAKKAAGRRCVIEGGHAWISRSNVKKLYRLFNNLGEFDFTDRYGITNTAIFDTSAGMVCERVGFDDSIDDSDMYTVQLTLILTSDN